MVDAAHAAKGIYVSIHSSGFRAFPLKPEIIRAIEECGFEHPSEVQHQCIPQAVLGMDILCQAKSGMGKTAVFVLATLQQIEPVDGQVSVLVMCHTRELAFQISKEYERFSKFVSGIKVGVFFGGLPIAKDEQVLKTNCPHIVVGTPGRILALVKKKKLACKNLKHFILDECDKMLEHLDMRRDVQEIFQATPYEKQVMMFSATLSKDIRPVCKKFMQSRNNNECLSWSLNSEENMLKEEGEERYIESPREAEVLEIKASRKRSPIRPPTSTAQQVPIDYSSRGGNRVGYGGGGGYRGGYGGGGYRGGYWGRGGYRGGYGGGGRGYGRGRGIRY